MPPTLLVLTLAVGHPGHGSEIERAAQVDVTPAAIVVTYYVGLSGTTMRAELDRLAPAAGDPAATATDPVSEQAQRERYAAALAEGLPGGLTVTVDGRAVPLAVARTQVIPRRGSIVEVTLTADWPTAAAASGPHTLTVTDGLLGDHEGGWKIAVRGKGVEATGDDVAPILVRATRHDMGHLDATARTAAATLAATIVRP